VDGQDADAWRRGHAGDRAMAGKPRPGARTQRPMAVRILYVEPSELERAAQERLWDALLSKCDGGRSDAASVKVEEKPA
jgi:hypothetical protein